MNRTAVLQALETMSGHLARTGTSADVWVYGGAAMVLAYQARTATRDIDAVRDDDSAIRRAADLTAEQLGLPRSWLNDQAASFVPRLARQDPRAYFDAPVFEDAHLRVMAANPRLLLAMKVLAARPTDIDDIAFLVQRLGLRTMQQVRAEFEAAFPDEPFDGRREVRVADALDKAHQQEER